LKAYYGDAARPDNDLGFGWVPRIVGDHSQLPMTLAMRDGVIRGMFMLGQNPAVGGHNAALVHRGLAELDWLVVRDMTETETASFWYAGRPVRDGELHPRDIRTEVFLMPASLSAEKAGSVTNTHPSITVARYYSGTTKWSAGRVTAAPKPGSSIILAAG
jgi:formate dehydrogenase major subunit